MCDLHDDRPDEIQSSRDVSAFVDELVVTMTNSRIYRQDHPRVRSSIESLAGTLQQQFATLARSDLVLGAADGYLFFDQRPLLAASRSAPRLLEVLARLESGGITFAIATQADDLSALIRFLQDERSTVANVEEANVALARLGCRHIRLLGGYDVREKEQTPEDFAGTLLSRRDPAPPRNRDDILEVPLHLHRRVFDHLTSVTMHVVRGEALDLAETRAAVERILTQLQEDATAMLSVTHYQVSEADQFQFRHSIRVACVALNFARQVTNDTELLHRIGTAALLHDVGKARVPFAVLHCKGRLSKEQFAEMSRHPEHGARILLDLADPDPLAVTVSFMHHRQMTGEGYPQTLHGLKVEDVSYATRIVKLCDVYEALTGYRPYRDPISSVRAYRTMLSMGDHFDRAVLRLFIRVNGFFPTGTRVELSTGETAYVESQTETPDRPVVMVDGRLVQRGEEREFEPGDLVRRDLGQAPASVRVVDTLPDERPEREEVESSAAPAAS